MRRKSERTSVAIIFEGDAVCAVTNCRELLLEQISIMKPDTDFLFLGWCWHYSSSTPPFCAHAYVVTIAGARFLNDNVDACGRAIDVQIKELGENSTLY